MGIWRDYFFICLGLWIHSENNAVFDINSLDSTCKEIMNNDTAIFMEDWGVQKEFKCRVGNKIYVIGGETK